MITRRRGCCPTFTWYNVTHSASVLWLIAVLRNVREFCLIFQWHLYFLDKEADHLLNVHVSTFHYWEDIFMEDCSGSNFFFYAGFSGDSLIIGTKGKSSNCNWWSSLLNSIPFVHCCPFSFSAPWYYGCTTDQQSWPTKQHLLHEPVKPSPCSLGYNKIGSQ